MTQSWQALKKQFPGRGEVASHGYAFDADHYCPDCLPVDEDSEEVSYIGGSEETDSPMHCTVCQALIPGSLTDEGAKYVREAWRKSKNVITRLWRREFDWVWR